MTMTMVDRQILPELISIMTDMKEETAYINPQFSQDVLHRLERIYDNFATTSVKRMMPTIPKIRKRSWENPTWNNGSPSSTNVSVADRNFARPPNSWGGSTPPHRPMMTQNRRQERTTSHHHPRGRRIIRRKFHRSVPRRITSGQILGHRLGLGNVGGTTPRERCLWCTVRSNVLQFVVASRGRIGYGVGCGVSEWDGAFGSFAGVCFLCEKVRCVLRIQYS